MKPPEIPVAGRSDRPARPGANAVGRSALCRLPAAADVRQRRARQPVRLLAAETRSAARLEDAPALIATLGVPVLRLLPGDRSVLAWPADLFPFQRTGVRALLGRGELLLADDMGLGKTVQAVVALRVLFHARTISSALVIVPGTLLHQWRDALGTWAWELRVSTIRGAPDARRTQWTAAAHVHLTTYETVRADLAPGPASPPRARVWDVVILDEAQRIKNRGVEVSVACKQVPRRRSWALTGTPLENAVDDLASVMEFLQPNESGEAPRPLPIDAALIERHRSMQLRRRKADVLADLPPKTTQRLLLDLGPDQRRTYLRAEREGIIELRALGKTLRVTHVLALITRLKQICNFCPETGSSVKLDDLVPRLEVLVAEGHRMLVFTQFVDDVFGAKAIAARIQRFRPLVYSGELSDTARETVIRTFRENPRHAALVLSLRTGGQGLNLQEASYVAHVDRWWNPAVERQAEDRSHRLGQRHPVTVYDYVCAGTIEERIEQILERKQGLFDRLIDDVTMDIRSLLTAEELFEIVGLAPPRIDPGS